MKRFFIINIFSLLLAAQLPAAEELVGRVIAVPAGDSIDLLIDRQPVNVRIGRIDCPEKLQPQGGIARQFTSQMIGGKLVKVEVSDRDPQGRIIGDVWFSGDDRLSRRLLAAGLAWQHPADQQEQAYQDLENEARQAKRGIWSEPDPMPPWLYRLKQLGLFNESPATWEDPLDALVAARKTALAKPTPTPEPKTVTIIPRNGRDTPAYVFEDFFKPPVKPRQPRMLYNPYLYNPYGSSPYGQSYGGYGGNQMYGAYDFQMYDSYGGSSYGYGSPYGSFGYQSYGSQGSRNSSYGYGSNNRYGYNNNRSYSSGTSLRTNVYGGGNQTNRRITTRRR